MQLRDCTERLQLFQGYGLSGEQTRELDSARKRIRVELSANTYFARLPARTRKDLIKGTKGTILTDDQILDRLGILDQTGRTFLRFVSSHADLSPLAYYRTGDENRGRGEPNPIDTTYMATAIDLACDALRRSTADVQVLLRDLVVQSSPKPSTPKRDERFESALNQVLRWEGENLEEVTGGDDSGAPLLCSSCFHDEGLRLASADIGVPDFSKCPNCGAKNGKKLSRLAIGILAHQFFVWGTVRRCEYGGYPAVQFNRYQGTSIDVAPWLEADLRLLERTLRVGFFSYGPRLWMVGEVEPLKALQEPTTRATIVARILNEYSGRLLSSDESFYRVRKAPARPEAYDEYDSPPKAFLGTGRLDSATVPVLYGSQDLEVCLHECRLTAEDEIYLATLASTRTLKLLNLAEPLLEEQVSEFESLDMAVHMLFLAGSHSYEISREIANAAYNAGFDGLVYPSYFSLLRTGDMPFATTFGISLRRIPELREYTRKSTISNLALFGRPVADGSVKIQSINRIILDKVEYKPHFGPAPVRVVESGPD
ncbi:MAG TPA: RES family NAD+ phosphorylase [Bryobacteraceae bacterium]|nr:RES family NAD+ phosphorylase [Bryobacteraceae bacterium]